jgi:hypothetical protein
MLLTAFLCLCLLVLCRCASALKMASYGAPAISLGDYRRLRARPPDAASSCSEALCPRLR